MRNSFELAGRDIHVLTVRMEASGDTTAKLESVLFEDEIARAARFGFGDLRRSFVIKRGMFRYLLGGYLGVAPQSIRFTYGSRGKPALASSGTIEFNTTHSGNLTIFAFTVGCQLGIDLQQIRPLPEMQAIAARFFCEEEMADLMSLPPSDREHAFFCCWTRKEAFVKATGDGLSAPLDAFRVTLRPPEPARVIRIAQEKNIAESWMLHDLSPVAGYAGAIAYRDRARPLSIFPIIDPDEFIKTT
ncbi:MAG: 4'-phosphopantetheinyl transferase superfamily protein [Acidobacteriaceae bacterium]|nr:4'-phosphopantetheinyl transferase superfamily protein [Acidobacteriaceae bacterium]